MSGKYADPKNRNTYTKTMETKLKKMPREAKIKYLVSMKKKCYLPVHRNAIENMTEWELNAQIKHYSQILKSPLGTH